MTRKQFIALRRGDIVRGESSGDSYVVDGHYGNFIIATKSMHVSNPSEWDLCTSEKEVAEKSTSHNTTKSEISKLIRTLEVSHTIGMSIDDMIEKLQKLSDIC